MQHAIVSQNEWLAARKALLAKEKEFTRARDQLSEARRALPWVKVEKNYVFEGPNGRRNAVRSVRRQEPADRLSLHAWPGLGARLPELLIPRRSFRRRRRSISPSAMWTFVVVSRAPFAEIEAYKKRMGWKFKWVSSFGNDFNHDFHVSFTPEEKARGKVEYNYTMTEFPSEEAPGLSAFAKNEAGEVLAHLFILCARPRYPGRGVQFPRFCAEGPRRRRVAMEHGMGAPSR